MKLTTSGLIAMAMHTLITVCVIVAGTVMSWDGSITGSTAWIGILAAAGIQVAGMHAITTTLRVSVERPADA